MYCYHCMSENKEGGKFCFHCGQSLSADSAPHHLKPGTVLNRKYLVGNVIGEGGFGITYIGRDLTLDIKIAIKEFYPNGYANRKNTASNQVTLNYSKEGEYFKNGKEAFLDEAKRIAKFSQEPGVVNVRDFFSENGTAYIIMEYLDGNNLSTVIKKRGPFESAEIFKMFLPMMKTLEKMHREKIIHRDISPENVRMLPNGTLKLMDFGSARYFAGMEKKTMSVQFKQGYAPFEQHSKNGNQGPWTDVYGLCATLYKCITGKTPADSLDRCQSDTLKKPSELGVRISPELEKILMYGLAIYPENRCQSMEELYRITQAALQSKVFFPEKEPAAKDLLYKTQFAENEGKKPQPAEKPEQLPVREKKPKKDVQDPTKKSPVAVIIIAIAATLLVAAGVIGLLFAFNGQGDSGKDNEPAEQTTTAEPTQPTTVEESTAEPPSTAEPTTDSSVIVPNVVGWKAQEAYNHITEAGLKYEVANEFDNEVPEGYVIKLSPAENTEVVRGITVSVTVSRGAKPEPKLESSAPEPVTKAVETQDRYNLRASERYLTASDLSGLSQEQVQFSINELYAKHGYRFTGDLGDYFGKMSWYYPDTKNMDLVVSRMNAYERANLKLMDKYR